MRLHAIESNVICHLLPRANSVPRKHRLASLESISSCMSRLHLNVHKVEGRNTAYWISCSSLPRSSSSIPHGSYLLKKAVKWRNKHDGDARI